MFDVVQLSHDVLTDRVLIGIQGPTPTDYISVACSLPDGAGQLSRGVQARAIEAASRLLADAAQALRSGQLGEEAAATTGQARRKTRFMCAHCAEADPA